jgi:hypothetical protein
MKRNILTIKQNKSEVGRAEDLSETRYSQLTKRTIQRANIKTPTYLLESDTLGVRQTAGYINGVPPQKHDPTASTASEGYGYADTHTATST